MLDQIISTTVEANDVCFSACAIIFMTGGGFEEGRSLERYVHSKANLGFHAPYVTGMPDRLYDNRAMETMYQMGIKAIRDLTQLGLRHRTPRNFLPQPLLAEMLAKGATEAFVVDTIYKVVRLDIRLFGYREPQPSIDRFGNACTTVVYSGDTDASLEKPPKAWSRQNSRYVERSSSEFWFAGFGAEGSEYCVVRLLDFSHKVFKVSRPDTTPSFAAPGRPSNSASVVPVPAGNLDTRYPTIPTGRHYVPNDAERLVMLG